jgi:hypothetical protein
MGRKLGLSHYVKKKRTEGVGFEVLTAAVIKIAVVSPGI